MDYKIRAYKERKSGFCGPASLKIVLDSFGVRISEKKLARLSHTTKDGVDEKGLLKAVKALGFKGFFKEHSSIKEIRKYLKRKRCRIVVGWYSFDTPHFSVVAKIDRLHIYLADPNLGRITKFKIDNFVNVWFTFDTDHPTPGGLLTRELVVINNNK